MTPRPYITHLQVAANSTRCFDLSAQRKVVRVLAEEIISLLKQDVQPIKTAAG